MGPLTSGARLLLAIPPTNQHRPWEVFLHLLLSLPYVVDSNSALALMTFVYFNLIRNMTTSFDCAGKDLLYRMSLCLHALKEQMQELEAIRGTHLEQAFPCELNEVRYLIFVLSLLPFITLSVKIHKSSRSGATTCSNDR